MGPKHPVQTMWVFLLFTRYVSLICACTCECSLLIREGTKNQVDPVCDEACSLCIFMALDTEWL